MMKTMKHRSAGSRIAKVVASLAMVAGIGIAASSASSAAARPAATIVVGTQTLTACGTSPTAYCGDLSVPLNYADPTGPTIKIAYEWYPAESGGQAEGTVVPVEGGPGYGSVGSVQWGKDSTLGKGGYYYMYGHLLDNWNMLAVDLRGTGKSTPLNCPALQNFSGRASGSAFNAVVAACAATLNHRWKYANGKYVHASDLFTSVPAAADVAAVVRALEVPKIDLYGDSYGSFFAQVFANHYPQLIRSLILDSTYQTQQLNPWYKTSVRSMPSDFDNACSRSPACAAASKGPAWDDIEALAAALQKSKITGTVPGPKGALESVTMGAVGLVNLLNDAAGDPMVYRGLDAAARADLYENDPLPLLRLYAQRLAVDESYFNTPASSYSGLLYMAVSCLDYPQLFNMNDSETAREAQLTAAEAALPASTFAPFTTQEWLAQDQNTEAYTSCVAWPSPVDAEEPPTVGQPIVPKSMPVLIMGGEFDTWTPPSGVPQVMKQLGGDTRFVEFANGTHVEGEADQPCGSTIVQEFVAAPQTIQTMDASCAARVPPIDSVGIYPNSLSAATPLTAQSGNTGSMSDLQLGGAVVETVGDALARQLSIAAHFDHGIYGGTSTSLDTGTLIQLAGYALVPGVAVTGQMRVSTSLIKARVSVDVAGGGTATFLVQWQTTGAGALATVSGTYGGHEIVGTTYAPLQTP